MQQAKNRYMCSLVTSEERYDGFDCQLLKCLFNSSLTYRSQDKMGSIWRWHFQIYFNRLFYVYFNMSSTEICSQGSSDIDSNNVLVPKRRQALDLNQWWPSLLVHIRVTWPWSAKVYHEENIKTLHYCPVVKGIYPRKATNEIRCHDVETPHYWLFVREIHQMAVVSSRRGSWM